MKILIRVWVHRGRITVLWTFTNSTNSNSKACKLKKTRLLEEIMVPQARRDFRLQLWKKLLSSWHRFKVSIEHLILISEALCRMIWLLTTSQKFHFVLHSVTQILARKRWNWKKEIKIECQEFSKTKNKC
jgi:hypothetical protein